MENFTTQLTPHQRAAMDFLASHLPASDLDTYAPSLFLQFADHALALREIAPWCKELDEEIFYHYVLFPRVNDEDLSFHREIFRAALWDRIKDLPTVEEKVLAVNRWCHENASYEMQDDRTASPLTVYRAGSGRCGEESGFLVAALRSVGIAARQVYAPRWAHCDDNHAWVEALCGGEWRFLGACEPEPILDRGWFNAPSSRALLIHSRLFGEGSHPLHGERICSEGAVTWFNQTARYAPTAPRTIRVTQDGKSAGGAAVRIQVLNEASFHTIAAMTADENGEATIHLGLGDVHVFAHLDGVAAECDCAAGECVSLALVPFSGGNTAWQEMNYTAPVGANINPASLTSAEKEARAGELARGRALREARIAAMTTNAPEWPRLHSARGNGETILRFLRSHDDPMAAALLSTLTDKDLRDVTAEILLSHLALRPPQGEIPNDIYIPYVLAPRIELEPLTAWRGELDTFPRTAPAELWDALRSHIAPCGENTYRNLVWTPGSALRAARCDERSLRILAAALLRRDGIPARLRQLDGEPEYWEDGLWHALRPAPAATLMLTTETPPVYRRDWTLSRRTEGGWQLLTLGDEGWENGRRLLTLPAGEYRVTTTVRLPNGNQFAAMCSVSLAPGGNAETELRFRACALSDLLRRQELFPMCARSRDGAMIDNICRTDGQPTVLFWLEEGGEPTEHVLNELLADRENWNTLPINVFFLLRQEESLRQPTLAAALAALHAARPLWDDWAYDLEHTARHLTVDPETPPLAVVCDREGCAVYGTSGYRVGSVELLRRITEHVAH